MEQFLIHLTLASEVIVRSEVEQFQSLGNLVRMNMVCQAQRTISRWAAGGGRGYRVGFDREETKKMLCCLEITNYGDGPHYPGTHQTGQRKRATKEI